MGHNRLKRGVSNFVVEYEAFITKPTKGDNVTSKFLIFSLLVKTSQVT